MGILCESLDEKIRRQMIAELDLDIESGKLYISKRLTEAGAKEWPELLRVALLENNDDWLASQLQVRGLMRTTEQRRNPKGGYTDVRVPYTAPETLAEGEFNRFYARGLCAHLIAIGETEVEVYRGKDVASPRHDSEEMIGCRLPATELLKDLRTSQGVDTALRLPPGPNSGLTVRIVKR